MDKREGREREEWQRKGKRGVWGGERGKGVEEKKERVKRKRRGKEGGKDPPLLLFGQIEPFYQVRSLVKNGSIPCIIICLLVHGKIGVKFRLNF